MSSISSPSGLAQGFLKETNFKTTTAKELWGFHGNANTQQSDAVYMKKANIELNKPGSSSRSNSKGKGKDKKKNDKKGKGKSEYLAPKAGIVKQKFQEDIATTTVTNQVTAVQLIARCRKRVNPRQRYVDDNVTMIAMVSDGGVQDPSERLTMTEAGITGQLCKLPHADIKWVKEMNI
ncbi:hypothetical protein Tco_0936595 [Tanacetum coccineum]|uniref:Uncharacterized protein n=1 Tax=Tanacetum coccineum TaxID=301880 RepID=A0ABQ5DCS1_9ASTR